MVAYGSQYTRLWVWEVVVKKSYSEWQKFKSNLIKQSVLLCYELLLLFLNGLSSHDDDDGGGLDVQ